MTILNSSPGKTRPKSKKTRHGPKYSGEVSKYAAF